MANVNIALELFGIAVSAPILFCCYIESGRSDRLTKILREMLMANILVLSCDALTWHLENIPELETLMYALNFLVYSLGYVITALFTYYLVLTISRRAPISMRLAHLIGALCLAAIGMVALSLHNHMFFSFEKGVYVRGELYWLSQVYPIGIMLVDMGVVLHYRRSLGRRDTAALLSYGLIPVLAMAIQIYAYGITLLYLATTLSLLIIYVMVHVEQTQRLQAQELELTNSRIAIMLSQIQPHFMYNVLATIRYLCDKDPAVASEAIERFAFFLRANMDSLKSDVPVSFDQELEHVDNYLYLEKLRFGKRLNVERDIRYRDFKLPTLSVQPMVENAVRYGVTKRAEGGTVRISTEKGDGCAVIRIDDDGAGFDVGQAKDDGRSHIGIDNVRDRLERQCGGRLIIESRRSAGTSVKIIIPEPEGLQ